MKRVERRMKGVKKVKEPWLSVEGSQRDSWSKVQRYLLRVEGIEVRAVCEIYNRWVDGWVPRVPRVPRGILGGWCR